MPRAHCSKLIPVNHFAYGLHPFAADGRLDMIFERLFATWSPTSMNDHTSIVFFVCMCMLLFLLISFWDIITALYFVYSLLCCKTVISLRNTETCLNSACSKVHLERIHSMTWELKVCPQHTNLTDWLEQVDPVTPLDANTACLRHDYTSYRSAAVKQGVAKWISQTRVQFSSWAVNEPLDSLDRQLHQPRSDASALH